MSDTAEGAHHAFITGPDGMGMRDLGTLGGDYQPGYWHQRRRAGGGLVLTRLEALTMLSSPAPMAQA